MPRPEGNKWVNSLCYVANYCPKPLGGDHRVFFALVGRKWVYLATGYNQRAKWTRGQWDDSVSYTHLTLPTTLTV